MRHLAIALALAGCATTADRGDLSEQLRTVAVAQVRAWNDAGVDPLQLSQEHLVYASTACLTITAVAAVARPDEPALTDEIAGWCAAAIAAAGPAQ